MCVLGYVFVLRHVCVCVCCVCVLGYVCVIRHVCASGNRRSCLQNRKTIYIYTYIYRATYNVFAMCIRQHACTHDYIFIFIYMYICIITYIVMYINMYLYIYVYICVCIYIYIFTYIVMYITH